MQHKNLSLLELEMIQMCFLGGVAPEAKAASSNSIVIVFFSFEDRFVL